MSATVPQPVVDPALIRSVLLDLAQRDPDHEDFENDWSALVGEGPALGWPAQDKPDEFADDLFVLVRTTPELYGGVEVDGHLVHHPESDSPRYHAFVGVVVGSGSGYYPALLGQIHDRRDLFVVHEDLTMTEYTVEVLVRIGEAARSAVAGG